MKKILFCILALFMITGCDLFNKSEEENQKPSGKVDNYVLEGRQLLAEKTENVTLNGKSHKLTFIYSYEYKEKEKISCVGDVEFCYVDNHYIYRTVLFDDNYLTNELINTAYYKFENCDIKSSYCDNINNFINKLKSGDNSLIQESKNFGVIKDNKTGTEYLAIKNMVYTGIDYNSDKFSVYVFDENGKYVFDEYTTSDTQITYKDGKYLSNGFYTDSKAIDRIIIDNNKITVHKPFEVKCSYKTCPLSGIFEYQISDGKVIKNILDYPNTISVAGRVYDNVNDYDLN